MVKEIKLGYEIGTGKVVGIKPSHLIVTGLSQLSGKTTTLEALTSRSGLRAIIFKTKVGERSFSQGTEAPPFFRDRSDYEFVKSLIEAYSREKLFLEKGTLMRLCKGSASLIDIKKRVDDDTELGKKLGVQGTPNFFINGRPLRGAVPYEQFKTAVDDELARGKNAHPTLQ